MFGLFKRGGGGEAQPSLDAIRFDAAQYEFQGEPQPGRVRVWHSPDGDGLGLFFFPMPPNLPVGAGSIDELAAFYHRMLGDSDGKWVEVTVVQAGGCAAVRTILSVPQQPSGHTYVASLTAPFRDFSFVLKCQCAEHGPTGFKAAMLLDRSMAANQPTAMEGGRFHIPGFDPDDPRHDSEFSNDPVARARRVLDNLVASLVVAENVRQLPRFNLPQQYA